MPDRCSSPLEPPTPRGATLRPGHYTFVRLIADHVPASAVYSVREDQNVSVVVPSSYARRRGWSEAETLAWIRIGKSSRDGAGQVARVASALRDAQIPARFVSMGHALNVFVDADMAHEALATIASAYPDLPNEDGHD